VDWSPQAYEILDTKDFIPARAQMESLYIELCGVLNFVWADLIPHVEKFFVQDSTLSKFLIDWNIREPIRAGSQISTSPSVIISSKISFVSAVSGSFSIGPSDKKKDEE
jgi:hypothetical protein